MLYLISLYIDSLFPFPSTLDKRYSRANYYKNFVNHNLPTGIGVHIHEILDENLFLSVEEIILKGFTNEEAAQYVEKCGSSLTHEEVKHVSGTIHFCCC